jgi:hypothetical protein
MVKAMFRKGDQIIAEAICRKIAQKAATTR